MGKNISEAGEQRAGPRPPYLLCACQSEWADKTNSLHSRLASFLGDPNFPNVAARSTTGGRIRLYQDLYKQYSRLQLSRANDRPMAIAGLERRLIDSLRVHGGCGVLDEASPGLLRRSLLWVRDRADNTEELRRIDFAGFAQPPPTWSWMAHEGGIDYLDVPGGKVLWETRDIVSPWTGTGTPGTWYSFDDSESMGIEVIVRDLVPDPGLTTTGWESDLVLDEPSSSPALPQNLQCVILGRLSNSGTDGTKAGQKCCVLLVVKSLVKRSARGEVYERVGAGWVSSSFVGKQNSAGILR